MAKLVVFLFNIFFIAISSAALSLPIFIIYPADIIRYLYVFGCIVAAQFVYGYYFSKSIDLKIENAYTEAQKYSAYVNSLQTVEVACETCKTLNNVNLYFNKRNTFVCSGCNSKNLVNIDLSTVILSEPLSLDETDKKIMNTIEEALAKNSSEGNAE